MKILQISFFLFSFSFLYGQSPVKLEKVWTSDTILRIPESVFYHQEKDIYYVTNMNSIHDETLDNDGFISKLSTGGKIEKLKWIEGLNDPKGMAFFKGKLYVGDLIHLVEIDVEKGEIIKKYTVEGAKFFNDVAVDKDGNVFVNDSFGNKVYRFKDGILSLWIEGNGLNKPNGLFINKKSLLANMDEGAVYQVNFPDKKMTKWSENIPAADGIAMDKKGYYYISNWNGEVYCVNEDGRNWKVLDTKSKKINAADIEYNARLNHLLVPTFFGNQVTAYKVIETNK